MDAGECVHPENVIHGPDIAGAEDHSVTSSCDEVAQELPLCGTEVFLFDGSAVDNCPRVTHVIRGVKDYFERAFHLRRVVETSSELHGAGNVRGNCRAHRSQHIDRVVWMREKMSAAIAFLHLLYGACEVHIHHVILHTHDQLCRARHLFGKRSHDLARNRVVIESSGNVVFKVTHPAFGRE